MTHPPIDRTAAVRPGEELDAATLDPYLRQHIPDLEGELHIEQFPGGHSNLTYLLRYGERELVLRRPPFGREIKTAHDMSREYRILRPLVEVYPKVPRPLVFCDDPAVIGAPFYVMERLAGIILRRDLPKGLDLGPDTMRRLSESFVDNFVTIHRVNVQAAGLGDLGKPEGYVRRQIEGWTRRYQDARTDDLPDVERVAAWLAGHMPPESGAALIHNDYKYDNLVLDPDDVTEIIGVLDWEMSTLGDPLMDLGSSLAYWIDADDPPELRVMAYGPTTLPGNLNRREVAERYAQLAGHSLDHLVFYFVYGLFKLIGIAQQIYQRYAMGHSRDPRFALMIEGVKVLGRRAVVAIERGRIDGLAG